MNYEQKYKEALERMKSWVRGEHPECFCEAQKAAEFIFPELAESEDERIRKVLIGWFNSYKEEGTCGSETFNGIPTDNIIAWLEKQGEQKKVSIWKHWDSGIAGNGEGKPVYLIRMGNSYFLSSCLGFECDYIELSDLDNLMLEKQDEQKSSLPKWKYIRGNTPLLRDSLVLNKYGCVLKALSGAIISDAWVLDYEELAELPREEPEKQGEQKPYGQREQCFDCQANYAGVCKGGYCQMKRDEQKPVDRTESKFKVGDWITDGDCTWKIVEIKPLDYILQTQGGNIVDDTISYVDEHLHLWTIQDAKDGDVLYYEWHGTKHLFIIKSVDETKDHIEVRFWYDITHNVCESWNGSLPYSNITSMSKAIPATKEQCDLLFRKMEEACYEFDEIKGNGKK